ncbi:SGNH/GDSL hydrolase family protein [Salinirubrum litoreum]|uniref:SGNH/GDSL hydrolase family protein n=1 Tax=Salinirubrum litoreum TaxID=1126234 RepID=A0ABD5R8H3_9EURY|nr:SGNH/GDSL hydrolase family protein [Salinirubrum litoreum]
MRLHVVGDSVPAGYGLDDPTDAAWPARLPGYVAELAPRDVTVDASTGRTLRDCADRLTSERLAEQFGTGGVDAETWSDDEERVVCVHAGHNDAQLSGGEPRVDESEFRETATELDARLAGSEIIDRHAFVGTVPLLSLDRPGTVPFGDEQPARGVAYDDLLAGAVAVHLRIVTGERDDTETDRRETAGELSTLDDWRDWTADGVHPGPAGHDFLARRVAGWLTG